MLRKSLGTVKWVVSKQADLKWKGQKQIAIDAAVFIVGSPPFYNNHKDR